MWQNYMDITTPEEDTGQTLGYYGVPGPYVVCRFAPRSRCAIWSAMSEHCAQSDQLAGLSHHRSERHSLAGGASQSDDFIYYPRSVDGSKKS